MNESGFDMMIARAVPADAGRLTEISFAAKRVWNYPGEYFNIWKNELTITPEYIRDNAVFKASIPGESNSTAGYVSIIRNLSRYEREGFFMEEGLWMEHLFVDPRYMHRDIGLRLVRRACEYGASENSEAIFIFVDPFARGFYEKAGAEFVRMSSSSIPGREIPVFVFRLT